MKLSEHFTLEEFTSSGTAARLGIDNSPSEPEIENLRRTADLLEKVRNLFGGAPVIISSGYRCAKLNKAVGSSSRSQHITGQAADFRVVGKTPAEVCHAIAKAQLQYDQCILEWYNPSTGDGWTHISWSAKPRQQALTINSYGTFAGFHV